MILAAGLGTRLYPLTKDIPKCMVEINGKPLIEHQIKWLRDNGITEIAINLHYLPEKIKEYLSDGSKLGVKLTYSFEEKLMGTAGGVKKIKDFFDEPFLVFYGDEFTDLDLNELTAYHQSKNAFLTICIRKKPAGSKASNIIKLNENKRIMGFVEKPSEELVRILNLPNLANCGIYICNQEILEKLPESTFYDFGRDVFPDLVKQKEVYGFIIPDQYYWCEIGRLEKYQKYKPEIERRIKSR